MLRPAAAVLTVLTLTAALAVGSTGSATAASGSTVTPGSPAVPPAAGASSQVLINEVANGGASSDSDSFIELRNVGDTDADLTGWRLFRCSAQGLRSNVGRSEGDLTGIVLAPGGILTISKVGMPGRLHITEPLALGGYGLYLEGPGGVLVDRVGVYPNEPWPTTSECTPQSGNLPNVLDFAAGESWQRVASTGDVAADFIVAPSTIDAPNSSAAPEPRPTDVVISELTGAGPAGLDDDFVELQNTSGASVDISGWTLDRCTASGRLRPSTRELVVPGGTRLAPGARYVLGSAGFTGDADARYGTQLGDVEFGVLLRTGGGRLVDRVAVSAYSDSACQSDGAKLAATLDPVAGESWQRTGSVWIIAPRTPGTRNALTSRSVADERLTYADEAEGTDLGVAISEIATDPGTDGMPAGSVQRNWIELGNYGSTRVDIGGWTLRRCMADGTRALDVQVTVPPGTQLAPGDVYLAARAGTEAAAGADAVYDTALNFLGAGLWVADARGVRVDSAGIYAANEMDGSNVTASPCTKGIALTTYQPDRMLAQTFQRARFTGVDADDFVVGVATPGLIDRVEWVDPTLRVSGVSGPSTVGVAAAGAEPRVVAGARVREREADSGGFETRATASRAPQPARTGTSSSAARPASIPAEIVAAWGGVSAGDLAAEVGESETALDPSAPRGIVDTAYGHPYQRLVVDGVREGSVVTWTGSAPTRHEVRLSVWSRDGGGAGAWRPLGGATVPAHDDGSLTLTGSLRDADLQEGRATLLVQDVAREATIASGPDDHAGPDGAVGQVQDGMLENPDDYDLAITHITDTQYLSESYPEVYAGLVSWIADNSAEHKIAFASHTGDLVQNWVDPDQSEDRARREFERASAIEGILDEAGVPNSVLPGNHDNKRGVTSELFNEYFPPSRYADEPWYGGSIAPDDNSASYSMFETAGAGFLMLSLPYAYGERELAWAEQVVAAHPDRNVVISTHEHVTPKTLEVGALRSANSRWVSRGQQLWDRVIARNRNVVLVLSGHFHGLGQITTEDAGGIDGHTVVELLADYQEFRTHTGERATGFQRLLQLDLAGGAVAVDTFSVRLDATASYPFDYRQFVPDNGLATTLSNAQPWRIAEAGVQDRYTAADDEFQVRVEFQYEKSVTTVGVAVD